MAGIANGKGLLTPVEHRQRYVFLHMYQEVDSQPFALLVLCACTPLAYIPPSCHAAALQHSIHVDQATIQVQTTS